MANGFQLTRPASHGAQQMNASAQVVVGTEFTCPGSGTQNVSEMGHFGDTDGGDALFNLSIYTDDVTNDCPEDQVSGSIVAGLAMPEAGTEIYGAIDPVVELTGGVIYWLCSMSLDGDLNYDRDNSGGNSKQGFTSGSVWPSGADWEGYNNRNWDMGIWAIYEAAASDPQINVNEQPSAADTVISALGDLGVDVADCSKPIDKVM